RALVKAVVNRDGRLRNDMHVVDIRNDANDALRLRPVRTRDLQDRIAPEHMAIDRVLTRKHPQGERLADDGDRLLVFHVAFIEVAPSKNRNAERGEKPRRDYPILRPRIFLTRRMFVAVSAKLQRWA